MLEIIILGLIFWMGYEVGMGVTAYRLRHLVFKMSMLLQSYRGAIKKSTACINFNYS